MSVLVGKSAPDFTAKAVMPDNTIDNAFNLYSYIKDHYAVLFFYPLDFTFVCPSEILAFDKKVEEFKKKNTLLIAVSVDSHFSHLAYKNTPVTKGGIGDVQYPIISDLKKTISSDYDVLWAGEVALRGTFIIDKGGIVRHQTVNDLPLGRNVDEMLRMIDAISHNEEYGEVCPANWKLDKKAMKPTTEGMIEYLNTNADDL